MVCENGTKTTIASSSKSFTTTSTCKSPVVWPNWKRDDYNVWNHKENIENTGGIGAYLRDGGHMDFIWNQNNNKALLMGGTACPARGQATTMNTYDVTDYAQLKSTMWCPNYQGDSFNFFAGIIKSQSDWLNDVDSKAYISWNNSNADKEVSLDINKYTGRYYASVQLLVGGNVYSCYCNYFYFVGKTYGYGNTGL